MEEAVLLPLPPHHVVHHAWCPSWLPALDASHAVLLQACLNAQQQAIWLAVTPGVLPSRGSSLKDLKIKKKQGREMHKHTARAGAAVSPQHRGLCRRVCCLRASRGWRGAKKIAAHGGRSELWPFIPVGTGEVRGEGRLDMGFPGVFLLRGHRGGRCGGKVPAESCGVAL